MRIILLATLLTIIGATTVRAEYTHDDLHHRHQHCWWEHHHKVCRW